MTLNEIGTLFMLWWITMGVVKGLWDMNNEPKEFRRAYKKQGFRDFMTFEEFRKFIIIFSILIWPIAVVYDARVKVIKLVHKIKRGF